MKELVLVDKSYIDEILGKENKIKKLRDDNNIIGTLIDKDNGIIEFSLEGAANTIIISDIPKSKYSETGEIEPLNIDVDVILDIFGGSAEGGLYFKHIGRKIALNTRNVKQLSNANCIVENFKNNRFNIGSIEFKRFCNDNEKFKTKKLHDKSRIKIYDSTGNIIVTLFCDKIYESDKVWESSSWIILKKISDNQYLEFKVVLYDATHITPILNNPYINDMIYDHIPLNESVDIKYLYNYYVIEEEK